MRKLIAEQWISLDGFAADRHGTTDFFPSTEQNRSSDEDQLKLMDTIDTILLGRKTYEIFAGFWPQASVDQEIMADKLNSIPKIVISKTLRHAPWGKWPDAKILSQDAARAVTTLKQQPGKNIIVWGSISLTQALMEADLIDEYRVQICPVRLGEGRPLFPSSKHLREMRLTETKVYETTGVVLLKYVV